MFIIKIERARESFGDVPYFTVSAESYRIHYSILHYRTDVEAAFMQRELNEGDVVYIMNAGNGATIDKYIVDTRA